MQGYRSRRKKSRRVRAEGLKAAWHYPDQSLSGVDVTGKAITSKRCDKLGHTATRKTPRERCHPPPANSVSNGDVSNAVTRIEIVKVSQRSADVESTVASSSQGSTLTGARYQRRVITERRGRVVAQAEALWYVRSDTSAMGYTRESSRSPSVAQRSKPTSAATNASRNTVNVDNISSAAAIPLIYIPTTKNEQFRHNSPIPTSSDGKLILHHDDICEHDCSIGTLGIKEESEPTVNCDSIETQGINTAMPRMRMVTFPQYVVASDRSSVDDLAGLFGPGSEIEQFRRTLSFHDKTSLGLRRTVGGAVAGDADQDGSEALPQRNPAERRSVKTRVKNAKPRVSDGMPSTGVSFRQLKLEGLPSPKGTLPGASNSNSDLIVGFYPDGMADYLEAKPITTSSILQKQSSNYQSSFRFTNPPPPTPSSALTRPTQREPPSKSQQQPDGARGKQKPEKTTEPDCARDPNVSSTSQMLLRKQMKKQTFTFPEITLEEPQNTDLPFTSRSARPQTKGARARGSSSERGGDATELSLGADNLPSLASDKGQVIGNGHSNDESKLGGNDDIFLSPRSAQRGIYEPKSSGNVEYSKKSGSKERQYRMLSQLGIPRVNLDIDRHHFSRSGQRRRAERLQQLQKTQKELLVASMKASSDKCGHDTSREPPNPTQFSDNEKRASSQEDAFDESWPGVASFTQRSNVSNHLLRRPDHPASEVNDPTEAPIPEIVGDVHKDPTEESEQGVSRPHSKASVSIQYYKMTPPGADGIRRNQPQMTSSLSSIPGATTPASILSPRQITSTMA